MSNDKSELVRCIKAVEKKCYVKCSHGNPHMPHHWWHLGKNATCRTKDICLEGRECRCVPVDSEGNAQA
jgi:hypothetical protein